MRARPGPSARRGHGVGVAGAPCLAPPRGPRLQFPACRGLRRRAEVGGRGVLVRWVASFQGLCPQRGRGPGGGAGACRVLKAPGGLGLPRGWLRGGRGRVNCSLSLARRVGREKAGGLRVALLSPLGTESPRAGSSRSAVRGVSPVTRLRALTRPHRDRGRVGGRCAAGGRWGGTRRRGAAAPGSQGSPLSGTRCPPWGAGRICHPPQVSCLGKRPGWAFARVFRTSRDWAGAERIPGPGDGRPGATWPRETRPQRGAYSGVTECKAGYY